ncbi:hypothetical protein JIN85_17380 [Luteolibacter pohnpeiensis]|uniref:Uncharacterized protein n=1 Tax=Luteolibacter pohnpeiensis TaxID=454153 RepID=A0A934VXB7_9BACT|nr:hypothetical protein [Luteolibacter pohnpeiensis]MBK1884195.1 hypothetical protein [Luteolibacter pohnpeiensis]
MKNFPKSFKNRYLIAAVTAFVIVILYAVMSMKYVDHKYKSPTTGISKNYSKKSNIKTNKSNCEELEQRLRSAMIATEEAENKWRGELKNVLEERADLALAYRNANLSDTIIRTGDLSSKIRTWWGRSRGFEANKPLIIKARNKIIYQELYEAWQDPTSKIWAEHALDSGAYREKLKLYSDMEWGKDDMDLPVMPPYEIIENVISKKDDQITDLDLTEDESAVIPVEIQNAIRNYSSSLITRDFAGNYFDENQPPELAALHELLLKNGQLVKKISDELQKIRNENK